MSPCLVRYWLRSRRTRRWPPVVRWGAALALVAASAALAAVPLLVWRPHRAWAGFDGLLVPAAFGLFLIAASIGIALAGAVTIAPERERGTWESLVLTPLGVPAIVRAKLAAQVLRSSAAVALAVPFWLSWGYEVLVVNTAGPMRTGSGVPVGYADLRTLLYLAWLGARVVGHALPFTAIGLAVSARSRTTRSALGTVAGLAGGYGLVLWLVSTTAPYLSGARFAVWTREPCDRLAEAILCWPFQANDWAWFSESGLLSDRWLADALADVSWMALVPYACYRLAVRACRSTAAISEPRPRSPRP